MPITNRDKFSQNLQNLNSSLNITATTIARSGEVLTQLPTAIKTTAGSLQTQFEKIGQIFNNPSENPGLQKTIEDAAKIVSQNGFNLNIPQTGISTALELSNSGELMDILASSSSNTLNNNELKYKIFIQFEGSDKNYYDDTLFLLCYRIGVLKFSSFFLMRVNLTNVLVQQLQLERNNNKIIKAKLFVYTVETDKDEVKLKNLVFERTFVVTVVKPRTDTVIERGSSVMCDLMLLNPVFFEMDNSYTYNKVLTTMTPYEALQDYEKHIENKYGQSFETKHILNKENKHKYRQIVTQPTKQKTELPNNSKINFQCQYDISIPLYLQYKYKIDNVFGFYFYDDFNLKNKKEITRYFLTFYDKNKFEKFKVDNQTDIIGQTEHVRSYDFADIDQMITRENVVLNYKLPNSEYATKKTQTSESTSKSTQIVNKIEVSSGDKTRFYNEQKSSETKKQQEQSANYQTLQVPDGQSSAKERVQVAKDVISKKIDKIDEFATSNCSFDWLQFGTLYAMNDQKPSDYLHTPISIVNVFHRLNAKENILGHMTRFMMIKFKIEENQDKSNNETNNSDSNKTSQQTQTSNSKTAVTKDVVARTKTTPTKESKPLSKDNADVVDFVHGFNEYVPKSQKESKPTPSNADVVNFVHGFNDYESKGPVSNRPKI